MQLRAAPSAHLTYCLNVHAGETLAQTMEAIRGPVLSVRDSVAPGRAFGLGLRLSNRASIELLDPAAHDTFQALLAGQNLYAFTVNGFPYGAFHDTPVKTDVYRPDWRTDERRDYTLRLARSLARLMPEKLAGSISTVPGSYKAWIRNEADMDAMIVRLADTAAGLDAIRRETGRDICLGLEPEPDCQLESTAECVAFFKRDLFPRGRARLAGTLGLAPAAAEEVLRRHIGVCFDTCHLAMQFEDLGSSLDALAAAGIRIAKLQLSAAIRARWHVGAADRLAPFCDPVYLHQVKTPGPHGPVSRGDLSDVLARPPASGEEWRIHCHVPLYWPGADGLGTTADQLTPALFKHAIELGVRHFEIETYTFNVLPPDLRDRGVARGIIDEFMWVMARGLS